jgi:hypothetical protein
VKRRALGFQLGNPKQPDACAVERGARAADGDPPLLLPAYTLAWLEGGRVAFIGETHRIAARFDDRYEHGQAVFFSIFVSRQQRISAGCLVSERLLRFRSIPYLSGRDRAECNTLVLAAPQLTSPLKQPVALSQHPEGSRHAETIPRLGKEDEHSFWELPSRIR